MSDPVADNAQSAGELPDIYSMSDEDIMNLDPSQFVTDDADDLEDAPADEDGDADAATDPLTDDEDTEEDEDQDEAEDAGEAGESEAEDDEEGDDDKDPDSDESDEKDEKDDKAETDYEAQVKKILAPFKANGKEMKVDNVEEAIQLMQMGANYNKKMASLKPSLKALKLLENNDLMGEENINYLIDLKKGNPEAIKKLIKESGIDPLDIDLEGSGEYTPSKHSVSDQELALDEVLDEIQDSEHYSKTVDLITQRWDETSKHKVAQEPGLLKVINEHMETGVYDVIRTELERQQMLGQLNGLTDLEAYKQVGDSIQARNGFDHLFQQEGQRQQNPTPAKRLPPKQKQEDPKLKEKRRAAAPSKGSPAKSKFPKDFNPLAMSDEEFEKHFNQKLL